METLFIQADEWLERLTLEALEARDDFTARVALSRFHALRGDYDRQLTVLEGLPDAAELLGIALAQGAFRAGGAQRTWMAQRALDLLIDVTWRSRMLVLLDRVDEALDALLAAGQNAEALLLAAPRQRWKVVRAGARRLVPADAERMMSAARRSPGRLGALYLGLAARFYPELRQALMAADGARSPPGSRMARSARWSSPVSRCWAPRPPTAWRRSRRSTSATWPVRRRPRCALLSACSRVGRRASSAAVPG